jgi:DNA-binding NarL/FixJ family response regulator
MAALTEDFADRRPNIGVRLAALALAAVADAAVEQRLTGDQEAARRWEESATELVELATDLADKGEEGARQGPEGLAWEARAEAEAARAAGRTDVAAWEKAVAAFDYGDVYERARSQRRLAEALLAAERREEAAEQAEAARETAVRLGAVPLREAVEALIRRGRLGAARPRADRAAVLTARERDVLLLLARGRTNRQIGEELFISGKTASVHVSNILAKLAATSRTHAVSVAYEQGLIDPVS